MQVLVLGCFILLMSHKSNLSFNSRNLPTVRAFSLAFPAAVFKKKLKKVLKSPEKIMRLYSLASNFGVLSQAYVSFELLPFNVRDVQID